MLSWLLNVFSHLGVFLISVKPMTTENTENKTTPKICKITVHCAAVFSSSKFEQSDGINLTSQILPSGSSISKVWSVKSSMRCENQSKLPWRWRCVTSSMPSESICNAAFFFTHLWDPVIFFFLNFESHVDQTWARPGIRVERQKLRTFRRVRRQR